VFAVASVVAGVLVVVLVCVVIGACGRFCGRWLRGCLWMVAKVTREVTPCDDAPVRVFFESYPRSYPVRRRSRPDLMVAKVTREATPCCDAPVRI